MRNFNYQPTITQGAAALIGGAVLLTLLIIIFTTGVLNGL